MQPKMLILTKETALDILSGPADQDNHSAGIVDAVGPGILFQGEGDS